jgi:hypothetical protein
LVANFDMNDNDAKRYDAGRRRRRRRRQQQQQTTLQSDVCRVLPIYAPRFSCHMSML